MLPGTVAMVYARVMASITSSMTIAQIEAVYLNNCSYDEDNNTTEAKAFRSAVRALILLASSNMVKGANSLSFNREQLGEQLKQVDAWIAAHPTIDDDRGGPNVTYADFSAGRG